MGHGLIPVLGGGLLYLAFRTLHLRMFAWAEDVGLLSTIGWLRSAVAPVRGLLPDFVPYTLPHCLWTYSFTFLIAEVWGGRPVLAGVLAFAIGTLSGVVLEFCQLLGLIPGTFDMVDIAGYLVSGALALAFHFRFGARATMLRNPEI